MRPAIRSPWELSVKIKGRPPIILLILSSTVPVNVAKQVRQSDPRFL